MNYKTKILQCIKQFLVFNFSLKVLRSFFKSKTCEVCAKGSFDIIILNLLPKTDVSWTASSEIGLTGTFTYTIV